MSKNDQIRLQEYLKGNPDYFGHIALSFSIWAVDFENRSVAFLLKFPPFCETGRRYLEFQSRHVIDDVNSWSVAE